MGVFIISSVLNFLDRNLLSVLAPQLMAEMQFDRTHYGLLLSAFSLTYAVGSLICGWALDRWGVSRISSLAVGCWSAASLGAGLITSFSWLVVSRAVLGLAESAGVPSVGKLNGLYLKPEERALGAAANQIGIALASIIAPLAVLPALKFGWRVPFVLAGLLGFVWIPLWLAVNRKIPPRYADQEFAPASTTRSHNALSILKHRSLLFLLLSNVLWMGGYSLWSGWTTIYLKDVYSLKLSQTPAYVWAPPFVSILGGFFGGWLSLRSMRFGTKPVAARRRAVWLSAFCSLITLLLIVAPNATWATVIISLSFFFALAGSVNIYALPIDIFGPQRSGLALGALTFAYGILQTGISPVIGWLADRHLYREVVWLITAPLFLGAWALQGCSESEASLKSE